MLSIALTLIIFVLCLLVGPAGVLVVATVIIGLSFVLTATNASPRPAPLGAGARLKLWLGEIAATWSVLFVAMPLERWLMPRDRDGARKDRPPVLLIHGYVNNAGSMWRLWRALARSGLRVHTLNLEPIYGDIDGYAPLIESRIVAIRAATGAPQVTLVCHSMGGLAARAFLRHCSVRRVDACVDKVISLGTPHRGTALARMEISPNGRQMAPDNAWLNALAAHEAGLWSCAMVSIYSLDDNLVAPQLNAQLEGARNLAVAGIGHISLPLSGRVIGMVMAEIDRA